MSSTKLSRSFMQEAARQVTGMLSGSQLKVNHEDCPAGEDTRRRLYLKITDDGKMLLAHCFNCGLSGGYKLASGTASCATTSLEVAPEDRTGEPTWVMTEYLFNKMEPCYENGRMAAWPNMFFHDCQKQWKAVDAFGVKYDDYTKQVYIPRYIDGKLKGLDIRTIGLASIGSAQPPKWSRLLAPDFTGPLTLVYNTTGSRTGVICEDPISAMKIALSGYAGIAICGTRVPSTPEMVRFKLLYDKVVVWLDNDKANVCKTARDIYDTLGLYSIPRSIEVAEVDPKLSDVSEIRDTVNYAIEENLT
jgi:hypothetical protein